MPLKIGALNSSGSGRLIYLAGDLRGRYVSRSMDEIEKDYIHRQKEIHQNLAYKDEFRQFLETNGIGYDEKDLWD